MMLAQAPILVSWKHDMDEHADDILKRALIDAEAAASVALRVTPLSLSEALTVVFHGRKDLGTIQTYVAHGGRGAGDAVGKDELMRVPLDLDLAAAEDRAEAEHLFAEQAGALRDALIGADTVLDIWREPFEDLVARPRARRPPAQARRAPARPPAAADRARLAREADRRDRRLQRPAARRGPPADGDRRRPAGRRARLSAARTTRSAASRTSSQLAAEHARELAEQLGRQEASVQRFLELSGEDFHQTG